MKPQDSKQHTMQNIRQHGIDSGSHLIEAEIEHGIPVKSPAQDDGLGNSNPITHTGQFIEEGGEHSDKELDHILQDVNKKVEEANNKADAKDRFAFLNRKLRTKTRPKPDKAKSAKPALAVIVAIIFALSLSVAAYYAFKPAKSKTINNTTTNNGKVGTSSSSSDAVQAAGGTLVKPSDLSDLSNTLQSKINGLNDSQDFNQQALSDQALGL